MNSSRDTVTYAKLYELAARELSAGLADELLFRRCRDEANGIEPLARRIYCEHRAKELMRNDEGIGSDQAIGALVAQIRNQEAQLRCRKERNRWLWAAACFVGFTATLVFSWFALAAVKNETSFYPLGLLSLLSVVLTLVSLVASRYHTDNE